MSQDDDDSIMIQIDLPKEQKAKISTTLSNWEYKISNHVPGLLSIFFVASDIYLTNLMHKKQQPPAKHQHKRKLIHHCILYDEIQYVWFEEDGTSCHQKSHVAELAIIYNQYKGLEILLRFGEQHFTDRDELHAKLTFYDVGQEVKIKSYPLKPVEKDNVHYFGFDIDQRYFQLYFKPKLAIEFSLEKQKEKQLNFRGIRNEGSTCYMNSTLQILFFIRPLRKIILQYEGKHELINILKQVFIELMLNNHGQGRSIDASRLLYAFGRFPDPRRQQDIHEFLLGFLQEMQNECPTLKQLWIGSTTQIITSRQQQKPYKNQIIQEFNELDLQLEQSGNTYGQMLQSLKLLLKQQKVDDKIDTDQYGKVQATKVRQFNHLPNIIFFNLKRYKYNKERGRPIKIMSEFTYPEKIQLGFLQKTPGNYQEYCLFGVAVHCGQAYGSGHYYSLVNTSIDPKSPYWIKFNDSRVELSSQETVLNYTGGRRKHFIWSKEHQRYIESQYKSQQTAYLLVYMLKTKFKEYQTIVTTIPKSWLDNRQKQNAVENQGKIQVVEVYMFDQGTLFEPFLDVDTIQLPLKTEENIHAQLKTFENNILCCQIGSIWKVHKKNKKIKLMIDYADLPQTPSRVFGHRRGHNIPDYLLIVPKSHKTYRKLMAQNNEKLGIVNIIDHQSKTSQARVINKNDLEQYKTAQTNKLQKRGLFEDKDRFMHDWTDYCEIILE